MKRNLAFAVWNRCVDCPTAALGCQSERAEGLGAGIVPAAVPGFQPSLTATTEAQKHAKYAVSAIGFDDVKSAVQNLTEALRLLTQP